MDLDSTKRVFHIEVELKSGNSRVESLCQQLQDELNRYFEAHTKSLTPGSLSINKQHGIFVQDHVQSIFIEVESCSYTQANSQIIFHIYRPHKRTAEVETFEPDQDSGEEVAASNHWLLPSQGFVGLWENLIYEESLKENLLKFAESSLIFSRQNVNKNVISCNRILLLHGPPGTGKTSLCRAIVQKLSIRLISTYTFTHLVEINSHSLFSKWFSESGKLVMKLFAKVKEIIADPRSLVCILIDEVESIAYARDSMSGQEPKDAMRVVNALLTQLDMIKEFPNILILTTSNIAASIDLAFLDRADIKQHVGLPSVRAVYQIYVSMLQELMDVGIVNPEPLLPFTASCKNSILALAEKSVGVSGRTLRKLPFLAHAVFVSNLTNPIGLEKFVQAMESALHKHISDEKLIQGGKQ